MIYRRMSPALLLLGALVLAGCASAPRETSDSRQERIESELRVWGIDKDPAIEEQRAEIEAAMARESSDPIFDSIELRTTAIHETDDKLQMQARLPLDKLFGANVERQAHEAATDIEIAQLEKIALEQRVRLCLPSLGRLVHAERVNIFDRFAERQHALLAWNRELRSAGLLDEVGAERFELSGQVSLARSVPAPPAPDLELDTDRRPHAVLPNAATSAPILEDDVHVVREQLLLNHPGVGVHRAKEKSYEALARKQRAGRYPSLRFVEFGFEPTTFPGEKRRYDAQLAFEIPFGREARASERRFRALATGQQSAERALVERSMRETRAAVEEINEFRRRGPHWVALLTRADAAEKVADRWQRERLADPGAIARLLDAVYDARIAVLEARERAGYAGCAVLATTGTSVDEWPL